MSMSMSMDMDMCDGTCVTTLACLAVAFTTSFSLSTWPRSGARFVKLDTIEAGCGAGKVQYA